MDDLSLKELGLVEAYLEEFVRLNVHLLVLDKDILVVGQQSPDANFGRNK